MRPLAPRLVAAFLAATVAVVSGVGEGLHFLPGLGHAVRLPSGHLLCLGVEWPGSAAAQTDSRGLRQERFGLPRTGLPPILAEDECAVCCVCANASQQARIVRLIWGNLLFCCLQAVDVLPRICQVVPAYRPRAPPGSSRPLFAS